jgi:K+-transporting ATPase KdpF subunit
MRRAAGGYVHIRGETMEAFDLAGLLLAIALLGYLCYVLARPERF